DDAASDDRALGDRLPDFGGRRLRLFLEQRAPRDDEVPAAFLVFDDAEVEDPSVVMTGFNRSRSSDVHLRRGGEGALARDAHLVAALDLAFDFAFDGQTGLERVFELPRGGRAAGEPA